MKLVIIRQLANFDPYVQAIIEFDPNAEDLDGELSIDEIEEYLNNKASELIRQVKKNYPEFCAANFHKRIVEDDDDQ